MTTDFRALCAELLDWAEVTAAHYIQLPAVMLRARAALAEGPTVPTDEDLLILHDWMTDEWAANHEFELPPSQYARAVLARWGTPNLAETRSSLGDAPNPVPVSERLPRSEDCDAEGKCWWGRSESNDWSADWTLATHEAVAEFCEFSPQTVWLPAHALPLPTVND